jgi:uracil-DNA glycosylase
MFVDYLSDEWRDALASVLGCIEEIERSISHEPFLPAEGNIFRALGARPADARVLIVGQDPYPNAEHAMGLAFSVPAQVIKLPASLKNIFVELQNDLGGEIRKNGDLSDWSAQGVVLLNRTLTLKPGESNSHVNLGWREVTDEIVKIIEPHIGAAILWGKNAQELSSKISPKKIISGVHPSPLSSYRGFFGSRPFSEANRRLREQGLKEIVW